MEWTNNEVLNLIEAYRARPILWDPQHDYFKISSKKLDAWCEIAELFGSDVEHIKKKINSLLASFRREKAHRMTKCASSEPYVSTWFAYKSMSFLLDKYRVGAATHDADNKNNNVTLGVMEDVADDSNVNLDITITEESNALPSIEDQQQQQQHETQTKVFRPPKKMKRLLRTRYETRAIGGTGTGVFRPNSANRDENVVFGEHVAFKLRRYATYTRNVVQHLINNILFDADMGKYDQE